ncbi:MAG: glycosyltransferase [Deltaproteobacteria bacterium]|nr:MAG: glycosyltransferase [Deltaproteobacteria bacterium]
MTRSGDAGALCGESEIMKRRIRVVSLINELLFGGDESRLLAFSRTVNAKDFDHRVVCVKRPDRDFDSRNGTMRALYARSGIPVADLGEGYPNLGRDARPMMALNRSLMLTRSVARFCRYLREHEIDVIDAHLGSGSLVGTICGALMRVPVAITTYQVEQWDPLWLWRRVHPAVLRGADAVVTDSQACAQAVKSFMGRPEAEVRVIPNGIEPPSSARSRAEMREVLGLPADPHVRVIGQIATLLPTKGQDVLLEAASRVLAEEPHVAFLLLGYPRGGSSYADDLRRQAKRLGVDGRVFICGYPGNNGDAWKVIDIHAHPTELDSLPQAIMEAMSLGIPSVVTPVGGIPTMVDHEQTGLIVPPRDGAALAQALLRLLREPETASRLGRAAQERYRQRYTTAIMTGALENLFAGLAN